MLEESRSANLRTKENLWQMLMSFLTVKAKLKMSGHTAGMIMSHTSRVYKINVCKKF